MDALARVSVAAAAATTEEELQADSADALAGSFADWAFVDLDGSRPTRTVAAGQPDLALAALLADVPAHECPLIASAMSRCAPVVTGLDDESMLGRLPGGSPVVTAIGAHSAAVAPVLNEGVARGAITIVRCADHPDAGFVELGVLSQIADLTNAAVTRLGTR
jgi:sigma-B regulation protein RsbU (phosphoserine phosphatase)